MRTELNSGSTGRIKTIGNNFAISLSVFLILVKNGNALTGPSSVPSGDPGNGALTMTSSLPTAGSGPRFVVNEWPSEVTFTPDRGCTIECSVWGQPAPHVSWLTSKGNSGGLMWSSDLAGNLISLSTGNGSLTLLPFRPEQFRPDVHAASYKCVASNAFGRVVSTAVRVRAVMLPPFEATIENPRVRRGSTAVFRCNVPESVRDHVTVTSWIQDNRYDIFLTSSQDGRHVMLPNGELHVLSVRHGDENHSYHCRVLVRPNGHTVTSSTPGRIILLPDSLVKAAPVIVETVNRVKVWRGQDAVLPCVYQGYPPANVKWFRSQTMQYGNLLLPILPIRQHSGNAAIHHVSGASSGVGSGPNRYRLVGGTLIVHAVAPEDQGRYICAVNNSAGSVEARTELAFREKLHVRIAEASAASASLLVADAETPVTITCSFTGSPRPTVVWLKDGQRYLGNGRVAPLDPGVHQQQDTVQLHIASVQRDDQGMYQCLATNDDGDSAQASVQLSIAAFPPHLKQTFTRQVVHPGSSVSFKCVASGTPLPHFTWTLDGAPLPVSERYFLGQQQAGLADEVITYLNISHARVEDGGHYKCVAENRVGRVEHSAALHVYGAPYVRPMNNVAAVGGKRLELPCPVAGYPIEGVTWEKDGRRLPINNRQRLHFNGSLTVDPVDKSADVGRYSCEARGPNGQTARQSFQLSVIDAPHIMPMAESAVVNVGDRLALQCAVVKGGLPLSLTWSKDGQLLTNSGHLLHQQHAALGDAQNGSHAVSVRLVNDFTASLTVESLTGQHAGSYVCRAANEGGRAESSVRVVVQAGPRITPFAMPPRSVVVHSRVQVSCVIEEGDPPFAIRWFKNGRPLQHQTPAFVAPSPAHGGAPSSASTYAPVLTAAGLRVTDFNAYSSILTIDQVTVNHGGNYSCRAENAAGVAVHSTLLQVSVPPMWSSPQAPPDVVQTVSGYSVELPCHVHGVPLPQITWSFTKDKRSDKYTTLFGQPNNRTLVLNQSLIISPVEESDEGYYQCEVSNGVGNGLSALVTLQVHSPPEVSLNQDYVAVRRGSTGGTVLKCSIRGEPPLHIQWRKDAIMLDSVSAQTKITTRSLATDSRTTISELSVTSASSADEGLYECYASNIYGEDSDSVFLQVQDVPQPPLDVRVLTASSRRVQLEWKAPANDGGNSVQEFVLHYKSLHGETREERISADRLTGVIDQLQPATSYHIYVTASNALGQSQPSTALTVTTDEETPEGPPLAVTSSAVGPRSFTVSWSAPAARLQNGVIHSYVVTVDSGRSLNRTVVSSGSNEYTVTGLRPNTNHIVYVQAVNSQGSGPPSPSMTVRTSEDIPEEAPLNVACVALSSQSLQITWQPPRQEYRNGLIRGYRVFYELMGDMLWLVDHDTGSSQTTTELTVFLSNLQKFSNYSIQVLAYTAGGDGVKSNAMICTTQEDIPEVPERVKVAQTGFDSLTVCWLPQLRPASQIAHYVVYGKEVERGQDVNSQKWTASAVVPSAGRLEIRNLRARKTIFYFQVAAVSAQAGEGPRSPTVSFTYNPPLPPGKVQAAIVSVGSDNAIPRHSKVILPCTALGDAPIQISWLHDGRSITDWVSVAPFTPTTLAEQSQLPLIQNPSEVEPSGPIQVTTNGSLVIEKLGGHAGGNYTCAARNRFGQDRVSYGLTVINPPGSPQLRFAASNSSSVTLQWSPAVAQQAQSSTKVSGVRFFVLKYRPRTEPSNSNSWTELILPAGWRSVPVRELTCGTEYEFALLASSRVGNSSSSNVVTARTKGSPPELVRTDDENDATVTPTSCTIDVSKWQDRGCSITQFVFRFRTADSSEWIIAGAEAPPQAHFLIGGLLPARDYVIRVTATNAAGSSQRDYAIRTLPLAGTEAGSFDSSRTDLAPLFSDPRVAVPMAISLLAIVLTIVTLLLRYRYRRSGGPGGDYLRPDVPVAGPLRTYSDAETLDGSSTLSMAKRPPLPEHEDDVSPYAVFPSLLPSNNGGCNNFAGGSKFSSTRRLKTFIVEGGKDGGLPVEMSNYAPPMRRAPDIEPTYDYIAPQDARQDRWTPGQTGTGHRLKLANHPHSVFVPIIPARGTWQRQHPHGPQDWDNQATLALSQRL